MDLSASEITQSVHLLCCSPSPTTVGVTKPVDEKDKAANEKQAQESVSVQQGAPTTSVQIRLADGSRLVATFNHTHTVGDIRRYVTLYPFTSHCSSEVV